MPEVTKCTIIRPCLFVSSHAFIVYKTNMTPINQGKCSMKIIIIIIIIIIILRKEETSTKIKVNI
jgi:hypothetical protein